LFKSFDLFKSEESLSSEPFTLKIDDLDSLETLSIPITGNLPVLYLDTGLAKSRILTTLIGDFSA
jgi:hypothetical protein